jgi:phosphoribosylamine---glycine ligase
VKVLVLGGGGREHALVWKLAQSHSVGSVTSAPGNPGMAELGEVVPDLEITDPEAVRTYAKDMDLVVVGPEAPLAAGVVDALAEAGIGTFGPSKAAARLESSKSYAKQVMARAGVPTASAASFDDGEAAKAHLQQTAGPYVVKADGLAAGKGVLVTDDQAEAGRWVDHCVRGGFGEAGRRLVIEEYLDGPELSVLVLCDGEEIVPLAPARDYKRLADGDTGPNTGGMGSYSPVPELPQSSIDSVVERIMRPVIDDLAAQGVIYRGILYAGLVLTGEGIKVLEFNCRFGDPEAQVILPRLEGDLAELLMACVEGDLTRHPPRWSPKAAVDVVLAAQGYPEPPRTGDPIGGLAEAQAIPGVVVFHAGTAPGPVTHGGRVINAVGIGADLATARQRAYRAAQVIDFPDKHYRTDIAVGADP